MPTTKWRIYHANVVELNGRGFAVTTENMFGREVDVDIIIDNEPALIEFLNEHRKIEPKFTSNWSF